MKYLNTNKIFLKPKHFWVLGLGLGFDFFGSLGLSPDFNIKEKLLFEPKVN